MHPCFLSHKNEYIFCQKQIFKIHVFKNKNMCEPRAFKCVVKINITNFNSIFLIINIRILPILKRNGANLIKKKKFEKKLFTLKF